MLCGSNTEGSLANDEEFVEEVEALKKMEGH